MLEKNTYDLHHKEADHKKKILLIEDDDRVCSFINKGLSEEGFEVSVAMDGSTGFQMSTTASYNLIIMDIMLPNIGGLDLCKMIRNHDCEVPILLLSALGSTENVVVGLNTGADDYLTKPFKFIELLARIRALLRRKDPAKSEQPHDKNLQFGDLILNDYTKEVARDGQEIALTSTEYRLLHFFMNHPRRVLSRVEILDEVWGVNFDMNTNVVDVYVNYLRKKLEKSKASRLIHTVIGMGYVLKENHENGM
ncbi:response regulator transcription factor [Persicitalea jodogahamensis]|uniref:DNA-binding response regulator n=1 Tax=Persicitalea jodogahamensis TaxID=402147 RepID=A0A8J3D3W3_9BACT|nr:response regulator transcription factor [Persicitalea jodogahamensis]GHB70753.1 DNA-binding response regulator [Persicitalea jodogahamensis]